MESIPTFVVMKNAEFVCLLRVESVRREKTAHGFNIHMLSCFILTDKPTVSRLRVPVNLLHDGLPTVGAGQRIHALGEQRPVFP